MEPIERLEGRVNRLERQRERDNKEAANDTPQNHMTGQCSARQSARTMLEEMVQQAERKASALQKLLGALPSEMPREADEALWEILCQYRNH